MTRLRRWYAKRMIARLNDSWIHCAHQHDDGTPCLLGPIYQEQVDWWTRWGRLS